MTDTPDDKIINLFDHADRKTIPEDAKSARDRILELLSEHPNPEAFVLFVYDDTGWNLAARASDADMAFTGARLLYLANHNWAEPQRLPPDLPPAS